ncbi:hypothetical protein BDF19DRAFT_69062 [Syncephalis fuscata]|nr:hypothetical protein BDF19DRAFT_69062 [Syncephalis fuscata]
MTTSSVASAATTVNSVLADTSVNHCTAGSVLERSANPTDGEASAVSLCNMSTTSHAIGDRGHGALLTPDYNDRRLGGRNNYLRNPSPLGMPTEGPIGYQRKQACVVGTRVDTSDDAFRTIKSDDQMRASTAYRALVTRFSEAWRMGSRLDMLRWRPDPRWHPDQPKYEQSYSVDQETRQDFATPNSQRQSCRRSKSARKLTQCSHC